MEQFTDEELDNIVDQCRYVLSDRGHPLAREYTREQRWQDASDTIKECRRIKQMRKANK